MKPAMRPSPVRVCSGRRTKQFAISAASNVQLAGKAKGVSGNLEISDFGQHLVKVKAAYAF